MKKYWDYFQKNAVTITLFLISSFFLFLLIQKLCIDQFFFSFLRALSPLLFGILIALWMHPFIISCHLLPTHFSRVVFVYGILVMSLFIFLFLLIPLLYVQIERILQYSDILWKEIEYYLETYHLKEILAPLWKNSSKGSIDFLFQGMGRLGQLFFSFFIAYFISLEVHVFVNEFKKIVINHQKWFHFYHTFSNILFLYVKGVVLDGCFIVISVGALLYLFDFPQAFFLAFLLAIFNLLPYMGAFIGVLFIAIVGFLSFEQIPWLALFLLVILQQVEGNIIHPLILNKTMSVHPLYLFVALLVGEFLFGFIGIIFSPILAAFMQILAFSYWHATNQASIGGWEDFFVK